MYLGYNTAVYTVPYRPVFVCSHCGKIVTGGELIHSVFYCPMCASIIRSNNAKAVIENNLNSIPECCKKCKSHPSNGGSGICNCILGNKNFY